MVALLPGPAWSAAAPTPPPAPDYDEPASWAARAADEGVAATVALGARPRRATRDVDIFYVHPTTDRSRYYPTQDIANKAVNDWTDGSVVARQAGAFNRCCRIFAPRYRQATLGAGYAAGTTREVALDFAYGDVLRAFDHYLTTDNHGRPFMLVGHSQGAAHVERLLLDRIDGKPLQKRMVAAYVIGMGVTEGQFGRAFKTVLLCRTPTATGCLVQWNAMLPTGNKADFRAYSQQRYVDKYGDNPGKQLVCINPLTFDAQKPAAAVSAAKGAVPGAPDAGPIRALMPHGVSAACEDGLLIVRPSDGLDLKPMADGSMHYHDVGLFYEDVRENADARAQAFLARSPRR